MVEPVKNEPVPYIAHESAQARYERIINKLVIIIVVLIGVVVVTNGWWIWRETQYVTTTTTTQTITQDTGEGGTNTFTGDFYGGDFNGEADSN